MIQNMIHICTDSNNYYNNYKTLIVTFCTFETALYLLMNKPNQTNDENSANNSHFERLQFEILTWDLFTLWTEHDLLSAVVII